MDALNLFTQNVAVCLGATKICDVAYDAQHNLHTIEVPVTLDEKGDVNGNLTTTFLIPNAISPQILGLSADPRNLGLSFNIIDVIYQ